MRADEHRPPEGSADMLGIVATIKVKPWLRPRPREKCAARKGEDRRALQSSAVP